MLSEENAVGVMHGTSVADRKKFAKNSLKWNMDNKIHKFAERFDKHFVKMGLREGEKVKEEKKKEEPEQPALKKRDSKAAEKNAEILTKAGKKKEEKAPLAAPELKKAPSTKQNQPKAAAAGAKDKLTLEELKANKEGNFIYVQCVKAGSKIRLRIVNSTNYNRNWNCQGPRNIRVEGKVYRIDNPKVKVMYGGATKASFYKLSNDASIY